MLKRIKLIFLFMVVFSVAFLLGNTPEGKADPPITVSQIEFDGEIMATLDGNVATGAYYKDADGSFKPMIQASSGWITNGEPVLDGNGEPSNGRKINFTTQGVATGSWVYWFGLLFFLAP